jgi:hypothetical protein
MTEKKEPLRLPEPGQVTEARLVAGAILALAQEVRDLAAAVDAGVDALRGIEATLSRDLLSAGKGR